MNYEWNVAYQYIMKIKKEYIAMNHGLDTTSVKEMCQKLNTAEYNNFLNNVLITEYGTLNLFKYSIVKGGDIDLYTNTNSVYREMRSLVIDMETDEIVLCPFRKFFNINELEETSIDVVADEIKNAKSIEIANKLDGSMQSASYYHSKIVMSGTHAMNPKMSFRLEEGYKFLTENYQDMIKDNVGKTFIFEYISLKDPHVVIYTKEQQGLYLLGIRNNNTGEQYTYNEVKNVAKKYGVKTVVLETRTLDEVLNSVDDYKNTEKEGWVLFVDGKMYKIKCTDYVQIHRLLSYNSANAIIRAIADEYYDDIISKIPEAYKGRVQNIANIIFKYIKEENQKIDSYWDMIPKDESQKNKALFIQKNIPKDYQTYMFSKLANYEYNVIKFKLNSITPQYIKMQDIVGEGYKPQMLLFMTDD